MKSVKVVQYEAAEAYDAQVELAECTDNAHAKIITEALINQMSNNEFLIGFVL